ncbi:uncharacterized protein LOC120325802 [Styela clava]|uniref:uncharacterized protein LOC120325802 n=1 Tax=Styela clava TaxID=7725 RepID=UPI00193A6A6A|nr:uncharacterized protein LOC120325802 [Styela clava]
MSDKNSQLIVVLGFFLTVIVCHWSFTSLSNGTRQVYVTHYDVKHHLEQSVMDNIKQEIQTITMKLLRNLTMENYRKTFFSDMEIGDCDLLVERRCYITVVYLETVPYSRAVSICQDKNSSVAQIPDENTYNNIMKNIRSKIPDDWISTSVWIKGPVIEKIKHFAGDSSNYNKWQEDQPIQSTSSWPNFYLVVDRDPGSKEQGMRSGFALSALRGVVCER